MLRYFILYKPYGMMSQFSPEAGKTTLQDLGWPFPKDVYPVGRLDADSEGLLLLTNDKPLNHRLLSPKFRHPRTYWAQVEGLVSDEALECLRQGVEIRVDGKDYRTLPAQAIRLPDPPSLPERNPPIRFRKTVPDCWIALTLVEGKNRQVRRMTAQIGHPTLRLVRASIGQIALGNLLPGQVLELSRETAYEMLFGKNG
jgi:23S rRNA pseudouridine2457 synthase